MFPDWGNIQGRSLLPPTRSHPGVRSLPAWELWRDQRLPLQHEDVSLASILPPPAWLTSNDDDGVCLCRAVHVGERLAVYRLLVYCVLIILPVYSILLRLPARQVWLTPTLSQGATFEKYTILDFLMLWLKDPTNLLPGFASSLRQAGRSRDDYTVLWLEGTCSLAPSCQHNSVYVIFTDWIVPTKFSHFAKKIHKKCENWYQFEFENKMQLVI